MMDDDGTEPPMSEEEEEEEQQQQQQQHQQQQQSAPQTIAMQVPHHYIALIAACVTVWFTPREGVVLFFYKWEQNVCQSNMFVANTRHF